MFHWGEGEKKTSLPDLSANPFISRNGEPPRALDPLFSIIDTNSWRSQNIFIGDF